MIARATTLGIFGEPLQQSNNSFTVMSVLAVAVLALLCPVPSFVVRASTLADKISAPFVIVGSSRGQGRCVSRGSTRKNTIRGDVLLQVTEKTPSIGVCLWRYERWRIAGNTGHHEESEAHGTVENTKGVVVTKKNARYKGRKRK